MNSSSSLESILKIGIIGFGPFAQFLAKTMLEQGHSLIATSRSDHSTLCSQMGIRFYRDIVDFIESDIDVVILSTSIISFAEVIRSVPFDCLSRRKKLPLFVDVLSVKGHPREILLQFLPEGADILCTHPMFGPESGKEGWQGLSLVYDKVRTTNDDLCNKFLTIFVKEGCKMVEMACEEHDRLAAKSQFLTHTIGRVLAEMKIESTPLDTKSFQALLQLKDNIVKDSFELYQGLFQYNRYAKEELENLELALHAVRGNILTSDHSTSNSNTG